MFTAAIAKKLSHLVHYGIIEAKKEYVYNKFHQSLQVCLLE